MVLAKTKIISSGEAGEKKELNKENLQKCWICFTTINGKSTPALLPESRPIA